MLRKLVLRANALYLGLASVGAFLTLDIPGIFFGKGPLGALGASAPQAGVGFIEAHGLAFILALLLWKATTASGWLTTASSRTWHFVGAGIHVLLGSCNLFAWEFFVSTDALAVGYMTTSLHWLFAFLQLLAASGALGRIGSAMPPVPARASA